MICIRLCIRSHRAFSSNTFESVLHQFSKLKNQTGVIPCDPEKPSFSTGERPVKPEQTVRATDPDYGESKLLDNPDEDEIKSNVIKTVTSLLEAQNIWSGNKEPSSASLDDESLTPAQRFYLENKELLLNRLVDYSISQANSEWDKATKDIQDDWAFYRDPIVRPARGRLWPTNPLVSEKEHKVDDESADDDDKIFNTEGRMPSVNELIEFLGNENVEDIVAVDLQDAGRRDIGEYALIGTIKSYAHGDRVSRLSCRFINRLKIDNVKSFSDSTPGQEWIVVRLGSIVVHLMTAPERTRYSLEGLYGRQTEEEQTHENSFITLQDDRTEVSADIPS
jgi:ribosomal silencing factor RsfS